jgi:hypothetical protein
MARQAMVFRASFGASRIVNGDPTFSRRGWGRCGRVGGAIQLAYGSHGPLLAKSGFWGSRGRRPLALPPTLAPCSYLCDSPTPKQAAVD